ncbi:cytidine deaminase [Pyrinomonas sp.]|uniref:cytidine deaminase n=1 Tax=Pyrinomonas sp. TaxID=2080306 RepID=UPI0033264682
MQRLIDRARAAREMAVAPYSGFRVGASIEAEDGSVFTGCNVENATYGLTVCAERVAIWKALSEGARAFRRLAVVADTEELTPPCGPCRQLIWEFCGEIEITMANLNGKTETMRTSDLLPRAFDRRFLQT